MSDSQKSQHKDRAPKSMIVWCNVPFCQLFIDFFLGGGHTCRMQKFQGQGSNSSHSSDNAESLAARPLENSLLYALF